MVSRGVFVSPKKLKQTKNKVRQFHYLNVDNLCPRGVARKKRTRTLLMQVKIVQPFLAPEDGTDIGGASVTPEAAAPVQETVTVQKSTTTPAVQPAQPVATDPKPEGETQPKESGAKEPKEPKEPMIPLSRFNEVNNDVKALKATIAERERKDREAEEARIQSEREAEEKHARETSQWQQLAEKREREIITLKTKTEAERNNLIRDKETRTSELERERETALAAARTEFEQELARRTVENNKASTEAARLKEQLTRMTEREQRLAALLSEGLDAEIESWPDEVKALDPGTERLEDRVAWRNKSRPIVERLTRRDAPQGNLPSPKPDDNSRTNPEEERKRLQRSGLYSL